MRKRLLAFALLLLLLLPALPALAETGTVSTINTTNLFDSYRGNGRWSELKTPKHRLNGRHVVYCLQHKKASPKGHRYDLTDRMDNYSPRVRNGLQIILENGYPSSSGGLSASQAEYATTNALRFWMSKCGDSQFYDFTNLGAFSDAQLRQMAADGLIPNKIRVRQDSYIPALQFSIELLIKARAQEFIRKDISLSASDVRAERDGNIFIGETQVSAINLRGGYEISTTEAKKSSDMLMKCQYISEITGNRGVVFATGTPISNSMTELYTMQRYLQGAELARRGLSHFDSWAAVFGETQTAIELAPEGTGYRLKTRFSKFYNLPELMGMFRQVADIQTPDIICCGRTCRPPRMARPTKTPIPVIPSRNSARQPREMDWHTYKERHLIENLFLKLKNHRRFSTRYEKKAVCFHAVVSLACILLWLI